MILNSKAFINIKTIPSYGTQTCIITWETNPLYNNDNYHVKLFKSRDGYTDWFDVLKVNVDATTGVITDSTDRIINLEHDARSAYTTNNRNEVVDLKLKPNNVNIVYHYQLKLYNKANKLVDESPVFSMYDVMKQGEFATLKMMLKNEIISDAWTDVIILRAKGQQGNVNIPTDDLSDNLDALIGQTYATHTDTTSYGKVQRGGYSNTPICTKLRIASISTQTVDMENGHGTLEQQQVAFKGLNYPRLYRGDLIINVSHDDRYLFEKYTKEYFYKGDVPFKCDGIMTLLNRNEIEYKVKI